MRGLQIINPQAPRIAIGHLQGRVPEDAFEVEDVSTGPEIFDGERVPGSVERRVAHEYIQLNLNCRCCFFKISRRTQRARSGCRLPPPRQSRPMIRAVTFLFLM
jgi:hypothetical protein